MGEIRGVGRDVAPITVLGSLIAQWTIGETELFQYCPSPWPSPERRVNRKSAAQAASSLWERVGVRAQEFRQIRIGPSFGLNSGS
jgi:hypothetical protein